MTCQVSAKGLYELRKTRHNPCNTTTPCKTAQEQTLPTPTNRQSVSTTGASSSTCGCAADKFRQRKLGGSLKDWREVVGSWRRWWVITSHPTQTHTHVYGHTPQQKWAFPHLTAQLKDLQRSHPLPANGKKGALHRQVLVTVAGYQRQKDIFHFSASIREAASPVKDEVFPRVQFHFRRRTRSTKLRNIHVLHMQQSLLPQDGHLFRTEMDIHPDLFLCTRTPLLMRARSTLTALLPWEHTISHTRTHTH